jgi:osmotically-inducible protein OsmY
MKHALISLTAMAALAASAATLAQTTLPSTGQRSMDAPPVAQMGNPAKPDVDAAAAKVRQALRMEKDVPADAISVTTHADVVVLSGEVDSATAAARAQAAAEAASGGVRISQNIKVRAQAEQSPAVVAADQKDLILVRNVEQALQRDKRTADLGVQVSIDAGQVIGLHGLVPSSASRTAAESVARQVAGVSRVNNRLIVPGG